MWEGDWCSPGASAQCQTPVPCCRTRGCGGTLHCLWHLLMSSLTHCMKLGGTQHVCVFLRHWPMSVACGPTTKTKEVVPLRKSDSYSSPGINKPSQNTKWKEEDVASVVFALAFFLRGTGWPGVDFRSKSDSSFFHAHGWWLKKCCAPLKQLWTSYLQD